MHKQTKLFKNRLLKYVELQITLLIVVSGCWGKHSSSDMHILRLTIGKPPACCILVLRFWSNWWWGIIGQWGNFVHFPLIQVHVKCSELCFLVTLPLLKIYFNPLMPELNPSAQRYLMQFFYWGLWFLNHAFR
jgi:hypothetical protein